jgi:hypothetical protein
VRSFGNCRCYGHSESFTYRHSDYLSVRNTQAISTQRGNSSVTVANQGFTDEREVAITLMGLRA